MYIPSSTINWVPIKYKSSDYKTEHDIFLQGFIYAYLPKDENFYLALYLTGNSIYDCENSAVMKKEGNIERFPYLLIEVSKTSRNSHGSFKSI